MNFEDLNYVELPYMCGLRGFFAQQYNMNSAKICTPLPTRFTDSWQHWTSCEEDVSTISLYQFHPLLLGLL